jgi:hypothetical protein
MNESTPFVLPRRVPLAVPGSRRIERCYALQSKARGRDPGWNTHVELVLLDGERDVRNVLGYHRAPGHFVCDVEPGWRVLGWRMADGSMPCGDYDLVDPELAQIDTLPEPGCVHDIDASPSVHMPSGTPPEWPRLLT